MTAVYGWVRAAADAVVWPFDLVGGWLGLTLFSVLSGAGMLWVMGRTTDQAGMERAKDQMTAAVYELRLYLDAPRKAMAAQGRLAWWNLRYIAHMTPAFLWLALPLALLYAPLDERHGWAPLATAEPVVVTVGLGEGADGATLTVDGGEGPLAVTAPILVDRDRQRAYLRVEASAEGRHILRLSLGDQAIDKAVVVGGEAPRVSTERHGGWMHLFALGDEPALASAGVTSVAVAHTPRNLDVLGLELPWWLYWLIVSIAAALALRRPMGVVL